jgi:hypothetical protein
LIETALAKAKRRGKDRASIEPSRKVHLQGGQAQLATGKVNVVLAAFRAGVKPKQIARRLGLSDGDRARSSDPKKQ